MTIDRKRLRELALAATPGPWTVDRESDGMVWTDSLSIAHRGGGHVAHTTRGRAYNAKYARTDCDTSAYDDAEFIAAANPQTILALLDALEAAEQPAPPTEDARLLDAFEQWANEGAAPALVFDDDGHWQVAFEGTQPVPHGDGEGYAEDAVICTFTEATKWHATVRDAIRAAIAERAKERTP